MKIGLTSDLHRGFSKNTDIIQRKYFARYFAENDLDALVLAGDLASHAPERQIGALFKMLRCYYGGPIYAVRGNHDFWGEKDFSFLSAKYEEDCLRYKVTNLEGRAVLLQNGASSAVLAGWLSWWIGTTPDAWRIRADIPSIRDAENQSYLDMVREVEALDAYDVPVIYCTHMPPNSGIWGSRPINLPTEGVLFTGHTHLLRDSNDLISSSQSIRVLNSGPDYDKPCIYKYCTETELFLGSGGNTKR